MAGEMNTGWVGPSGDPYVRSKQDGPPFALSCIAGGLASGSVDAVLHPLDTLKTRLQAPQGFFAAGGYTSLFRGVFTNSFGAMPSGAIFFAVYEFTKNALAGGDTSQRTPASDAAAASLAATASSVLRVPTSVVTQRMQVGQFPTVLCAIRSISVEGGMRAFYAGLGATIAREIPFSFIQFPLYEWLKVYVAARGLTSSASTPPSVGESAICGAIAGSVAAALTTPFDLLKTRQMLGGAQDGMLSEAKRIVASHGAKGLFRGVMPRMGWMALGGYLFFGVYEQCLLLLTRATLGMTGRGSITLTLAQRLGRDKADEALPSSDDGNIVDTLKAWGSPCSLSEADAVAMPTGSTSVAKGKGKATAVNGPEGLALSRVYYLLIRSA